MDDVLSLIRSLLEDMDEPEEVVRPEAIQAEQEVVDRVVEEPPKEVPPEVHVQEKVQSRFRNMVPVGTTPVSGEAPEIRTEDPVDPAHITPTPLQKVGEQYTEVLDPLRFAAAAVTAVERERKDTGEFSLQLNASVSSKQVTPNIRVETIIPNGFPVDAREIFSLIDREITLPQNTGGDPFLSKMVELPPPAAGDSTEQAIAKHYASIQGQLDLDVRNTFE
jgi:hypothetical protein